MKSHTIVFRDRSGSMQGLVKQADALADLFLHYPGTVELWDGVEDTGYPNSWLVTRPTEAWGPWPAQKFEDAAMRMISSPAQQRLFVLITDEPEVGMPPSAKLRLDAVRRARARIIVIEVRP